MTLLSSIRMQGDVIQAIQSSIASELWLGRWAKCAPGLFRSLRDAPKFGCVQLLRLA